jgi:hypothetical protein
VTGFLLAAYYTRVLHQASPVSFSSSRVTMTGSSPGVVIRYDHHDPDCTNSSSKASTGLTWQGVCREIARQILQPGDLNVYRGSNGGCPLDAHPKLRRQNVMLDPTTHKLLRAYVVSRYSQQAACIRTATWCVCIAAANHDLHVLLMQL